MTWNPAHLPDQSGRTFVVTGGNAGLGYFTAEQLASTGARVVLASRNGRKAQAAIASIRTRTPHADLDTLQLDLASLESVHAAGAELASWDRLDGVILNAGLTSPTTRRETTPDGLELTLATNHLGHFALTAAALPVLERTPGSRIVGLGSIATRIVRLDEYDLQSEISYSPFTAYAQSKHAVHGFVYELDRRLRARDATVSALLAHPGFSLDGLSSPRPGIIGDSLAERALAFGAQGKNRGATPIVRALLDPAARGGEFYGPAQLVRGEPVLCVPVASSASPEFGRRLWALSEHWTGTPFRA